MQGIAEIDTGGKNDNSLPVMGYVRREISRPVGQFSPSSGLKIAEDDIGIIAPAPALVESDLRPGDQAVAVAKIRIESQTLA